MLRSIQLLCLIVAFSPLVVAQDDPEAADDWRKVKPISLRKWAIDLEKLGAQFQKQSTDIATEANAQELVRAIADECDGKVISFKTRVTEVKWKDGIATLYTSAQPEIPQKSTLTAPILMTRFQGFEIKMNEGEASLIKVGTWLAFVGRLKFHPLKWGAVGKATSSQELYQLRYPSLVNSPLGTFTTTEYELKLDREDVNEAWASE